ncbi:Hsp20/alpha crystallin family protein [Microbulbifer harenosus]|uniref:Hsp20/alpha crystallin family protein n=1 Tax=Microbulbifer harenosus TaxID=2576840 RepID=A0ABY2UFT9_9GAMM|nr:Hsp20/alpha crystallin family protein [Microbulbifer harenosus]TLM76445.1 Hsp20/alpha crystallin family protein [Microbulbifer harenosus]
MKLPSSRRPTDIWHRFQDDFDQLTRAMGDRWPSIFEEEGEMSGHQWRPSVDVMEEDDHFLVKADIPGVDPKDIEVTLDNGCLVIRGERKWEKEEKKEGYMRTECSHGTFYRRFNLPETADPDNISAKGKDGVLTLTIGKREVSKPKRINIQ